MSVRNRRQFQRALGGAPDDDLADFLPSTNFDDDPANSLLGQPQQSPFQNQLQSIPPSQQRNVPQFQKIPASQTPSLQPINRAPDSAPPAPYNSNPGQQASNAPNKTVGQRVGDLEQKYGSHKKWGDFFRTLGGITALVMLALIAAYIITTVLTSNGTIGPGSLSCIECNGDNATIPGALTVNYIELLNTTSDHYFDLFTFLNTISGSSFDSCITCEANGTLVVKHNLQVNGNSYFFGNVTTYENLTSNQISLLNTTSDVYFDLFNFLNNLVVSALPCAYCAPNGTFITNGDVIIGGNGTLTVNYIELLNTTDMMYFDVFTFLNDLDRLLNNLTIQYCTVIQVCGPSGNITKAIADATALAPSDTNSVGIEFCPGTYVIPNSGGPLVIPHFVSLQARVAGSVSLTPSAPNNVMFQLSGQNNIYGFDFYNGGNAVYITQTVFVDGGVTVISDCTMRDGRGLYASSGSGGLQERVIIRDSNLVGNNGATTTLLSFSHDGSAIVQDVILQHAPGGFGIGINGIGVNAVYTITDCSVIGLATGILTGAIQFSITVSDLYASDISYAVISIPSIAAGVTELYFNGIVIDYSYGFVARVYNIYPGEEFVYQFGDIQHYNCTEEPKPSHVSAVYIDVSAFESAVERVLIDESVGVPEKPQSSFVGSGKNTLRQLLLYTFDGSVYTDVQTELCNGNTFDIPIDVNNALYAAVNLPDPHTGEPFQHYGLLFNVNSASVPGGFVLEYWDGTTWRVLNNMVYNTNYPYIPKRNVLPMEVAGSTTIHYDWRIKTGYTYQGVTIPAWVANDPPGFGTNLFWVRFIVSGSPFDVPTISSVQYTTNSMETNEYGLTLYHGFARRLAEVDIGIALFQPKITTPSTGEFVITFSGGLTSEYANAQFPNSAITSRGFSFVIPGDCDTSSAIEMVVTYRTTTAANGNMIWMIGSTITENTNLYASVVPTTFTSTVAVTAAAVNQQTQAVFLVYYTNAIVYDTTTPGRTLGWFFIERDGTNIGDTYAGVMQLVSLTAHYTKRMEGIPLLY